MRLLRSIQLKRDVVLPAMESPKEPTYLQEIAVEASGRPLKNEGGRMNKAGSKEASAKNFLPDS